MPNVIADITMSLDGFVTGDGADEQHELGDARELHTWVMQRERAERADMVIGRVLSAAVRATGRRATWRSI